MEQRNEEERKADRRPGGRRTAKNEETFDPNYPLFSLNRYQTQRYRVRVYICTIRFGSVRRGNPVNYGRKKKDGKITRTE